MLVNKSETRLRGLSIAALVLALLGGAFYWWMPMGMVASLAGLTLGFADWTRARRRSLDYRLSIVAMLLALATLALNIFVAAYHLQTLTFYGQ